VSTGGRVQAASSSRRQVAPARDALGNDLRLLREGRFPRHAIAGRRSAAIRARGPPSSAQRSRSSIWPPTSSGSRTRRVWQITMLAAPTPTPISTLRIRRDCLRETTRTTSLRRNLCSPRGVWKVRPSGELETNSPFSARLLVTTSIGAPESSLPSPRLGDGGCKNQPHACERDHQRYHHKHPSLAQIQRPDTEVHSLAESTRCPAFIASHVAAIVGSLDGGLEPPPFTKYLYSSLSDHRAVGGRFVRVALSVGDGASTQRPNPSVLYGRDDWITGPACPGAEAVLLPDSG
jgi:hypothetical protein